jgi:hypothetical protein
MNSTKQKAQQLILQPIVLQYNHTLSMAQKIAGSILLIFFLMLGTSILFAGFKAVEYGIYYLFFGAILCSFPFLIYLIIENSKKNLITLIDKDGLTLKNNKKFDWENLKSIMHHAHPNAPNDTYLSVEFKFSNGNARATYHADKFPFVLFIAQSLPLPKTTESFSLFR